MKATRISRVGSSTNTPTAVVRAAPGCRPNSETASARSQALPLSIWQAGAALEEPVVID